ncbi:hypothetical protein F4212_09680 [Candidatus Poribacteria bacterium]|nr:hypothetical protein [Candidatus Poribacteria bacterium]
MQYDKDRYEIRKPPHPDVLFWVLFPVFIFNELILGQRRPKVSLIDKKSDKPWLERIRIPCPHCETLNDSRIWANRNALGHWFGLVCPNCHQIIPCLWNIFSLAILTVTYPLWYFPAKVCRPRWLEKEKERLENALKRPLIQAKNINWLLRCTFGVGGFTWMMLGVIPQVRNVLNGEEWDLILLFVSLPIYLGSGLLTGLLIRLWMNRTGKGG